MDAVVECPAASTAVAVIVCGPAGNATRVVQSYASFLARHDRAEEAKLMLEEHRSRFPDNPVVADPLPKAPFLSCDAH